MPTQLYERTIEKGYKAFMKQVQIRYENTIGSHKKETSLSTTDCSRRPIAFYSFITGTVYHYNVHVQRETIKKVHCVTIMRIV